MNILQGSFLETIMDMGRFAPSGGNIQPWKIFIKQNVLSIAFNKTRSQTFLDVQQTASIFSIGCFMENILQTAEAYGCETKTIIDDSISPEKPFVHITFLNPPTRKIMPTDHLANYIKKRITNRKLHHGPLITTQEMNNVTTFLTEFNKICSLHTVSSHTDKQNLATILGQADAFRTYNPTVFAEMMKELRWNEKECRETNDGIDITSLEMPKNLQKMLFMVKSMPAMRKMMPKFAFEEMAKPVVMHSSHLCCLTIKKPLSTFHLVTAGRAVERFWLESTKNNISVQPWTVLTFFLIRAKYFGGQGYSPTDKQRILNLGDKLQQIFHFSDEEIPIFIFRLSKTDPLKLISYRHPWKSYTTIA